MSFPTIPNITPSISLSRADVINLLLASVAFEELGLAHVINAEGEKIQATLGTLPGQTVPLGTTFSDLISIDQSVQKMLQTVIKNEMLLQFKLEDILELIPTTSTSSSSSSSTSTSTSTSTTSTTTTATVTQTTTTATETTTTATETTTTATVTVTTTSTTSTTSTTTAAPLCPPALTNAIFVNLDFTGSSQSIVNANVQINGNLTITHSGNTWLGTTNVHGTSSISSGNTITAIDGAPLVPQVLYNETCLFGLATVTHSGDLDITTSNQGTFAGQIVFVDGNVNIHNGVTLPNTTIFATGDIQISGQDVTISNHTGTCFALYSSAGNISITNGNYNVTGVVYTRVGDITITASHGGNICGSIQSGGNVTFTGGTGSQNVTNIGACAPCGAAMSCNTICSPTF